MKKFLIILLILFINIVPFTIAQKSNLNYAIGFKADNDSFLAIKQDRYYTNGLFLFFKKSADTLNFDTTKYTKKIWGIEMGHKMYNPQSGNINSIYSIDRPFAGYLYLASSFSYFLKNETNFKLNIQFGTIGPNAKGKEIQEFIHKTFGFYDINGWEFQVNNELGINLNFDYEKLLYRSVNKDFDISLPISINLGNTFTNARISSQFRTGKLNPFYHSSKHISNIGSIAKHDLKNQNEWYFYYLPSLSYIFYDATIQGGMFIKDKGLTIFKPNPTVFSNEFGFTYTNQKWTSSINFVFNSKEVKSIAKAHQYGSISLFRYF